MKYRVSKSSKAIVVFTTLSIGGIGVASAQGWQGQAGHWMQQGGHSQMQQGGHSQMMQGGHSQMMQGGGYQKMSHQMMKQGRGMFGGRQGGMFGNDRGIERMMEVLDLTDTQRDLIWKIVDARRSAQRKLASDLKSQKTALRELMGASSNDLDKVKEVAGRLSSLIEEQIVERANTMIQIHAIFTDEQKKKLEQHKQSIGKQHRFGPQGGYGNQPQGKGKQKYNN